MKYSIFKRGRWIGLCWLFGHKWSAFYLGRTVYCERARCGARATIVKNEEMTR